MIRQWVKIMLMAMLVFIQTACPKLLMQQDNDVRVHHPSDDSGGSDSGSG
jgi:hypothetical protein